MKLPAILLGTIVWLGLMITPNATEKDVILRRDVFISGRDGYHTYRIPAMVITSKGTVLVFCEGRRNGPGDSGNIDLLLKRSGDNGRNWADAQVVHEQGGQDSVTVGNPCPIVERHSEIIHLLFTVDNKRLYYTRSLDDGLTWAVPKEHTTILQGFDYPLVRIATGPGHGIQMKSGRLVAPVWVCDREVQNLNKTPSKSRYQSGIIYSDDAGETWQTGGLVPPLINRLNESTVVEREDGSLLLNMRAFAAGLRAAAISTDAGISWSTPVLLEELPCPTCQASMIRTAASETFFLNPSVSSTAGYDKASRRNLTLRLSPDDGKTWSHSRVINEGPAGYSDLSVTDKATILCVFENGAQNYHEKISIVEVTRHWLTAGVEE